MAPPGEPHDAEQPASMWQELNRPRSEPHRGSRPAATPPSPVVTAPPRIVGERTSADRIDPQLLLLIGAGLFVAVTFFALSGLGGSGNVDAPVTAPTPNGLAAVVDNGKSQNTTPTSAPGVATEPQATAPTTEPAPPMAMGLPASLLDSEQSQVYRLYRAALDREPDRDGFEFWSDQIREGVPLEQLANEFLASAEYQNQFVAGSEWDNRAEQLLTNAFGPAADQAELDVWRERFGGLDGPELLLAISEADETLVATGTLR